MILVGVTQLVISLICLTIPNQVFQLAGGNRQFWEAEHGLLLLLKAILNSKLVSLLIQGCRLFGLLPSTLRLHMTAVVEDWDQVVTTTISFSIMDFHTCLLEL
jgi:hypothetical protein